MIDKGDGDREQKQQQRDNLRDVITFCENKIDCRRSQVLGYFGENFDKSQCNRTCDNCERNTELMIVDRTSYAIKALKLAQEIDDRYTLIGLLDAFRGSAAKKALKYQDCEGYGAGRELSKTEAERLLQSMVTHQALRTYNQTNPGGFTTSYLKLGPKWKELETGKMKITLTVCEEDAPYKKPPLTISKPSKATSVNSKSPFLSIKRRPAVVVDSEEEDEKEQFGYLDEDLDEYENSFISESGDSEDDCHEEEYESKVPSSPVYNKTSATTLKRPSVNQKDFVSIEGLAPEYRAILHRGDVSSVTTKAPAVATKNPIHTANPFKTTIQSNGNIAQSTENIIHAKNIIQSNSPLNTGSSNVPSSGLCYDYLIQWRDRVAQDKKLNTAFVLSNSVLGQIARQLPLDTEELAGISGMTHDKITKYGTDILSITNRYIL